MAKMTSLFDRVKAILIQQPHTRNSQEIGVLLSWFRKKSEVLQTVKNGNAILTRNCLFRYSTVIVN